MRAGALRHRVGFYKRVTASDGAGNTQSSFGSDAEFVCEAGLRPRLGGEDVLAGRLTGRNLVNITVRRSQQSVLVTEDWLAKDERTGESYNIRSIIDPDQGGSRRGMFIEMLCEKGVAA